MRQHGARLRRAIREPRWAIDKAARLVVPRGLHAAARYGPVEHCRARALALIGDGTGPVVVFPAPGLPWGFMTQRPQQLARALTELGCRVLYAADQGDAYDPDRLVRGAMALPSGVVLYADGRDGRMLEGLASALPGRSVIAWQYWPCQRDSVERLGPGVQRVYDSIDHLGVFASYAQMHVDHAHAVASADVVLATSESLAEPIRAVRPDAALCPNAVRVEDFEPGCAAPWPELEALRARSSVIVGYYGALGDWVDWGVIDAVASARPDWTVLLVGQAMGRAGWRLPIGERRNVVVWPRQPYERLAALLHAFDAAMIPFKPGELTHAVSPVKLFEYAAGGVPIVASPIRECLSCPAVRVAPDAGAWVRLLEEAAACRRDPASVERLRGFARRNTWRARASAVLEMLGASSVQARVAGAGA